VTEQAGNSAYVRHCKRSSSLLPKPLPARRWPKDRTKKTFIDVKVWPLPLNVSPPLDLTGLLEETE